MIIFNVNKTGRARQCGTGCNTQRQRSAIQKEKTEGRHSSKLCLIQMKTQ